MHIRTSIVIIQDTNSRYRRQCLSSLDLQGTPAWIGVELARLGPAVRCVFQHWGGTLLPLLLLLIRESQRTR